jgi:glycine/D-amino acid oxidase-like deaminating enzyme
VADVGIVGAGILGLATAHALARRGASAVVYDHGSPGAGQSAGEARIFRHAHDDPRLVAFARDSRALWDEWGERFGVELVSGDGAVAIGPSVDHLLHVLREAGGVPARHVGGEELAERVPILAGYDGPAMLDERGGSIRTRAAIEALSGELGDALVRDEVLLVRPTGSGTVEVRSGQRRTEHDRVVVCAGRDSARLVRGLGLTLPVRLAAHVRLTFEVRGDPPSRLACLQDGSGDFGEVGVYASALPGNRAYAVGLSQTTAMREDASPQDAAGLASLSERAEGYVRRALPGLRPEPAEVVHCWVTALPWSEDGVAIWEAGDVRVIAGHNLFKQAPGLGRALAAAALGESVPAELRPEARLGAAH